MVKNLIFIVTTSIAAAYGAELWAFRPLLTPQENPSPTTTQCTDFAGKFAGICTYSDGQSQHLSLEVRQSSCEQLDLKFQDESGTFIGALGGTRSEENQRGPATFFSRKTFRWGNNRDALVVDEIGTITMENIKWHWSYQSFETISYKVEDQFKTLLINGVATFKTIQEGAIGDGKLSRKCELNRTP